jgi:serine/threonine-protein kinase
MDVEEALEFADKLIYVKTGKHLNDLEREVFSGSWQGHIYEKIYPINPEYVEKDVGYKLWKKLSKALGEKVTKKNVRGALERSLKRQPLQLEEVPRLQPPALPLDKAVVVGKRVFISHRAQEPDFSLAVQLCEALKASGHQAFMATVEANSPTTPLSQEDCFAHIDTELKQCDYFLLLLSPQAAVSEMVIEELRRAKELRDSPSNQKLVVLPIRVNCPLSAPLNHDLRSYLQGIGQREWASPADTLTLIQEILSLLAQEETGDWGLGNRENESLSPTLQPLVSSEDLPLPVAEPELPSGQVRLASAFYVERVPDEALCYKAILQPGALIRIKAPRQMGKTSLMARILYQAKEQGYRTVPLSFQHADTAVFRNLNELLQWFCARITRKLRLPYQVDDHWTDTYGSKDNCTAYFEDCLLSQTDQPLVLGLDEVDRVFKYPEIADDFFALLRAWYEEAGYGDLDSDLWAKLRLVVVHSTEVYVPLDINQSPFNVGLPIELSEFSPEQVWDLAQRHGLNWRLTQEVEQLMKMVGGHPYLVRVALYHLAQQQLTLAQLVTIAATEAGIYGDHLRRHLWNLQQHPELAAAFSKVVKTSEPVELESVLAFKLHSLGLVQLQRNEVRPRFELYRQYFRDRLLDGAAYCP